MRGNVRQILRERRRGPCRSFPVCWRCMAGLGRPWEREGRGCRGRRPTCGLKGFWIWRPILNGAPAGTVSTSKRQKISPQTRIRLRAAWRQISFEEQGLNDSRRESLRPRAALRGLGSDTAELIGRCLRGGKFQDPAGRADLTAPRHMIGDRPLERCAAGQCGGVAPAVEQPFVKTIVLRIAVVQAVVSGKLADARPLLQKGKQLGGQQPGAAEDAHGRARIAQGGRLPPPEERRAPIRGMQFLRAQDGVGRNVHRQDRLARREMIRQGFTGAGQTIFKFQGPQPEQLAGDLPPAPERAVERHAAGR